jgi:hypothetical protein
MLGKTAGTPRKVRSFVIAIAAAAAGLMLQAGPAAAHHSFAVFFDPDKVVTVSGTVKDFQFSNPHGILTFVAAKAGKEETWKAETNAPVILRRLGWSPDILKPGDKVTVEGWRARDGSNYLRLRRAFRGDGSPVGLPIGAADQK